MTAGYRIHTFEGYGVKKELTPAEREWWQEEASRQEIRREDHQRYADEAYEARQRALRVLGMIASKENE